LLACLQKGLNHLPIAAPNLLTWLYLCLPAALQMSPPTSGLDPCISSQPLLAINCPTHITCCPADEPTSGLDSYTSNEVMTVVKSLATHGITICATVSAGWAICAAVGGRLRAGICVG